MMRKALVLAMVFALPLTACGEKKAEQLLAKAPSGPRLAVALSQAPDWQSVSAEVTSQDQAQVMARGAGVLSSLSIRAGDTVRRGQVIGRISDTLGGGASASAAASAQAGLARADLERVRYLYQNGVYAKARLDQAEAMARIANAQASGASAAQSLIAPASGRVLRADVPAGAAVAPGMVVAVVTSGPVLLRLELPEALAARIQSGARVQVDGMAGEGTVTRIYPAVNAGQVSADVAMAGLDARLIGRRMPARVAAGTHQAILVPRAFISTRYGLDYAMVVAKDGSATQVPVQTAAAADGKLEVLSGINAGDTLVAAP
jgi:RND family efflux transporter MFP subunit